MSFVRYKELIEVGDTVIVFLNVSTVYAFVVKPGDVFQTKYGAVKHADLIGKRYGSMIDCGLKGGWAHVLHPTPELWTLTLPHRTQILYSMDISVIVFQLELKPGSVVCEAGTGSGSLSHALMRAISPTGHLYTFDFHEERVELCREEFVSHGVGHLVTSGHRDVVNEGFGLDNIADAVFLDLPVPWDVVAAAKKALKYEGGRICSFSPCIEQVQRMCEALQQYGFSDIATMECIQRPLDVRSITMPILDTTIPMEVFTSNVTEETKPIDRKPDAPSIDVSTTDVVDKRHCPTSSRDSKSRKCTAGVMKTTFMEALPPLQTIGHTGYLTFASLYPKISCQDK